MCGRFSLTPGAIPLLADAFGVEAAALPGRWNIAPTQPVAIVRVTDGRRELVQARWGLLPAWLADAARAPLLINARADTVSQKPAFRDALRRRRCLVPADGFFEWAPPPAGASRAAPKQPHWFRLAEGGPLALAGLWEGWTPPGGRPALSVTLITTEANACVAPVHDRMPVILPREAYATWLDPSLDDPAAVLPLLRPYPAEWMTRTPVSTRLNAAREDDPSLVEPASPVVQPRLF
ncbi:MAG: SOS response-associated peptidase [Candidatus Sericytochromatia bacterium]|nr:SOS response-associated peptidase [Candidatus Sericytochromatia bacterium]